MTSHLHTVLQVVIGGVLGIATGIVAVAQEANVFSSLAAIQLSPTLLLLCRMAVTAFALPVVFKKEFVWIFNLKRIKSSDNVNS